MSNSEAASHNDVRITAFLMRAVVQRAKLGEEFFELARWHLDLMSESGAAMDVSSAEPSPRPTLPERPPSFDTPWRMVSFTHGGWIEPAEAERLYALALESRCKALEEIAKETNDYQDI